METDLALVLGLLLAGFSVPALMSAISDGRPPRISFVMILAAGALVLYAVIMKPGGYTLVEMPDVFFGVVNRFIP